MHVRPPDTHPIRTLADLMRPLWLPMCHSSEAAARCWLGLIGLDPTALIVRNLFARMAKVRHVHIRG